MSPYLKAYAIGDSTVAAYLGGSAILDLVTTSKTRVTVAVPGDTIAQQKDIWSGLPINPAEVGWVIIQIGLNDTDPTVGTAAIAIVELQDLVNTVRADVGTNTPILISKMLPCRQRLINLYGKTDGALAQARWVSINDAIAGVGGSPITNVQGRIMAHALLLDDGTGNLDAAYDTGDDIHPNNAGRAIMARAWEDALAEAGVTV